MPVIPSPYFDNPSFGQIAQNMMLAIGGDPEARAKRDYYGSEIQKNQAAARLTGLQADRLGMSNTQLGSLADIFSAEQGTVTPSAPPIPFDQSGMEGEVSTGPTVTPPSADALARLQARELTAYAGDKSTAEQLAQARLHITALPFLTSTNPDLVMQGSTMIGHPYTKDDVVNSAQEERDAQQASDKGAREADIKGGFDLAGKRIEAGASIQREGMNQTGQTTREAMHGLAPGTVVVMDPRDPRYWTTPNHRLYGLPNKAVVEGAAGTDIAKNGATPTNTLLYTSKADGGAGKATKLNETEASKGELSALQLVPGATTQAGNKTLLTQEFVDAMGPDRRAAGRAAYDNSIKTNPGDPARAEQAYRDAAGLTGAKYTTSHWWMPGSGLQGATDINPPATATAPPAAAATAAAAPQSATAPVHLTHDAAGVAAYNALPNGAAYVTPEGIPKVKAGPQAAAPQPVVTAPQPPPMAANDTEASYAPARVFGVPLAGTGPQPTSPVAQVFSSPFPSEAAAKQALNGPRDAEARNFLGMVPAPAKSEPLPDFSKMTPDGINRFINNPGTSAAAKHAAAAYAAGGGAAAPAVVAQAAPALPTPRIDNQKIADMVLTAPPGTYPADLIQEAHNFNANRYGGR